jgi:signal peptidase II
MLWHGDAEIRFSSFFSFKLCFNRGISWGMLHSHDTLRFVFVITMTADVTSILAWYTFKRVRGGHAALWEALALSGAVSNLFDRLFHGGVIDFILFSYGNLLFPSFNIADACIVVGVCFMMLALLKEDSSSVSQP